ncbi:Ger(x)C family spore germination protein [Chengkuizengella axinellae]|uniref:Ger(X)C family spore germination protein n=1 Tax=Chengkuizengella axinellae TaxID=3064388 RepID=A0ABT9J3X6_9BACL|nr:Ger(x)C family spore germination protein [Chengkuizengella sp. 2205SS18-9]MDP5276326.1 Ger(x)C family spore germination protein [Chengkuizengella sp. 2205SS18-9]
MLKRYAQSFVLLLFIFLLNGCWDQRLLNELFIVIGEGVEKKEDKLIVRTAFVSEEEGKQKIDVVVAEAGTLQGNTLIANQFTGGTNSVSDILYTVMSSEVAKEIELLSLFSVDYVSSSNVLKLIPIVTDEEMHQVFEIIETKNDYKYTAGLLEDAAYDTITTSTNLQKLLPLLYDPAMDFTLPYLTIKQNKLKISGIALFHDKKYSGSTLLDGDATFLLLMANQKGTRARIEVQITEFDAPFYVLSEIKKSKSEINIDRVNSGKIKASIDLSLQVFIQETSNVNQYAKHESSLNKILENHFTEKAKGIIQTLQEANCDVFGFGRELRAYYPEVWKTLDWETQYPSILIEPHISVEIINMSLMDF